MFQQVSVLVKGYYDKIKLNLILKVSNKKLLTLKLFQHMDSISTVFSAEVMAILRRTELLLTKNFTRRRILKTEHL
jgi:hypothetical protein